MYRRVQFEVAQQSHWILHTVIPLATAGRAMHLAFHAMTLG